MSSQQLDLMLVAIILVVLLMLLQTGEAYKVSKDAYIVPPGIKEDIAAKSQIPNLTHLCATMFCLVLILGNNAFTGAIPPGIGSLQFLTGEYHCLH